MKAQVISTIAGPGPGPYGGDGGPATNASLGDLYYTYPAFDNAGNLYFASANNTIRKIDPAGIITRIAGIPDMLGYAGDGGPAINALLAHPNSIAVDDGGNILFADGSGNKVRQISPSGIITTASGLFATTCNVCDGGPLINAQFRAISSFVKDAAGNIYFADFGCCSIRKLSVSGIITTVAGDGSYGFSGDGGPAINAQLSYPCKVAVDNAGNIYIPDAQNHRIRKVDAAGIITTIAGTGVPGYSGDGGLATQAELYGPGSVVIDRAGNLYISDHQNTIRKIDASGIITTYAGNGTYGYSGDGGLATLAVLNISQGRISIDGNNNIYFNDDVNGVIRKISNCLAAAVSAQPVNVSICTSGNANFAFTAANALTM